MTDFGRTFSSLPPRIENKTVVNAAVRINEPPAVVRERWLGFVIRFLRFGILLVVLVTNASNFGTKETIQMIEI